MMKKYLISLLIILTMGGCGKDNDYLITIITPFGEMKAILYDETPEHKKNFIKLALEGKYDSTIFHRIIKEFMVQGGDINQKKGNTETIDYTIPAEFIPKYYHKKGALAAARQGDQANPKKASSGSQFYIVQGKTWTEAELTTDMNKLNSAVMNLMRYPGYDSVAQQIQAVYAAQDYDMYNQILFSLIPDVKEKMGVDVSKTVPAERLKTYTTLGGSPWLDDQYTVFGEVVEGIEIIDQIAAVVTDRGDRPVDNIHMTIKVEEMPKKKITKLYGVQYPETDK